MSETTKKTKRNISITKDDMRQVLVIGGNEMRKFFRGRKILLLVILAALFLTIDIVLTVLYPNKFDPANSEFMGILIIVLNSMWVPLIALLGAVLFASYTIVSEFEERTYLLLFTRPVKKTTIFVGKFLASYLITLLIILLYYCIAIGHALAFGEQIDSKTLASIGFTMAYIFAVSGLAMLFSCISKKGSISALMTFFLVSMVPVMITVILTLALSLGPGEAPWYILDEAANSISSVLSSNIMISQPLITFFIWGIIPLIAGWIIFLKREA